MSLIPGEDPCEKVQAPTHISISTASSSILLCTIVATVGNALVVLVVFLNPNRDMRKPFHYFVANLSIADLIVGLITGSMSTIYHIFAALNMTKERFGTVMIVAFFVSCTVSLLSLKALAMNRNLAITQRVIYQPCLGIVGFKCGVDCVHSAFDDLLLYGEQYISLYLSKHSFSCHHGCADFSKILRHQMKQ